MESNLRKKNNIREFKARALLRREQQPEENIPCARTVVSHTFLY